MGTLYKWFSLSLIITLTVFIFFKTSSALTDTINTTHSLTDGETLVSSGGTFELGFFSPGKSKNRYLGIWYKRVTNRTVVWVANREVPLNNTSGVLKVIEPGILVIQNGTKNNIWSSNTSHTVRSPVAQLLESGNLVVRDARDGDPENYIWESFIYPTDTLLPGLKFGWNFVTGIETYFSSWKSEEDPAPGDFTSHMDPTGYAQVIIRENGFDRYRVGPWNGIGFSGGPNVDDPTFSYGVVSNKNEQYYHETSLDKSVISRFTLSYRGVAERYIWVNRSQSWINYYSLPGDNCDNYKLCGAYGKCTIGSSPACECLDRFVPNDPDGWRRTDWSAGCTRRTPLDCQKGDIFLKYSGIRLPDTRNSTTNVNMMLDECKSVCLRNCSCTAYSTLDIRRGGGCLLWWGPLLDIKSIPAQDQDLYIRMSSSEPDVKESRSNRGAKLIASLTLAMGLVLVGLVMVLYIWNKKKNNQMPGGGSQSKDSDLPFFKITTIMKATNNFSNENKLGEGGYGPVFKGTLEEGQEIAVKRLSNTSKQGIDEFKNEIIVISKLQHRNLVRLLGCCIEREEKMLIYEHMPNGSLDLFLFDRMKSISLDWRERLQIIKGIARGLLYLHQDSRLRIIHRDLKASNILLDADMNPKISDFGMARSFAGNEIEAKTGRVVGTIGYMSPEYAVDGLFSTKSDVFSFGVLVLEVVTGKRNRGFFHSDHQLNLLGHAWKLYKEGRLLELADPQLCESYNAFEVTRSIHVGLLCVQQNMENRPSMSTVVLMLASDGVLPPARRPGFFTEREVFAAENLASATAGEMTITQLQGR